MTSPVVCALLRFIGTLASDSTMALDEDFLSLLPFVAKFRCYSVYCQSSLCSSLYSQYFSNAGGLMAGSTSDLYIYLANNLKCLGIE